MRPIINISAIASLLLMVYTGICSGQPVPGSDENIPFLMTFGKGGHETSWGDDDFSQTFFFTIPIDYKEPFYIRVYDPDVGGNTDEMNGYWDTKVSYTITGGKGCYTDPDAKGIDPIGNYKSGTVLASRVFGVDPKYDEKWLTFGPFNPADGEYYKKWACHIFKIVCDGLSGNDGNLYRYFLSRKADENVAIQGANAFTYEYTFRMWNNNDTSYVSHIYPFIDSGCIYVRQKNFDWDNDGNFIVVSVDRKGQVQPISGENVWQEGRLQILPDEIGKSLDFRYYKRKDYLVKNNNVVMYVENQYGEKLPFFTVPIGGVPVYKPKIKVTKK
jgi:hypothetical protein